MQMSVSAAVLANIHTHTDSNGYFSFALTHLDDEHYRLGGGSNEVSVWLPAPALLSVEETPGWTWTTTAYDGVVWRYEGEEPYIAEGMSVAFAYTSAWHGVAEYAGFSRTSAWPAARVTGVLYDSNHVRVTQHPSGDDEAWAAAIPCIEHATVLGPVVPEGAGGVLGVLLSCCQYTRRVRTRGSDV